MSLFRPVYMDQRVALSPTEFRDAAADMDAFLLKKLRRRLEERCCTHGYVRGGSTQILARSMGQAEHCRFTGDFMYHCKVRVLCYLPEAGQTVDAQVLMANKAGVYALLVDQGRVSEAMRIFLPRDFHLGNTAFDELRAEQVIRVRLLRARFKASDPFINVAGVYLGASTVEVTARPKKLKSGEGGDAATSEESVVEYETRETEGGGFEFVRAGAPQPLVTREAAAAKVTGRDVEGGFEFTAKPAAPPMKVSREEVAAAVTERNVEGGFEFTAKPAAADEGKEEEEEGAGTSSGAEETSE